MDPITCLKIPAIPAPDTFHHGARTDDRAGPLRYLPWSYCFGTLDAVCIPCLLAPLALVKLSPLVLCRPIVIPTELPMPKIQPAKTAQAEFLEWYRQEKAKGLVDIKFYPGDTSEASTEAFFSEINAMNHAIAQGQSTPLRGI